MSSSDHADQDLEATMEQPPASDKQDQDATYVPQQTNVAQKAPGKASASKKVTQIGDFKIMKKLGQGGMGAVYLAHQVSLDRKCALKTMSKQLAAQEAFVKRFIREARVMAKIDHPNVVRSYAVGEYKGMYYVAMEFIDGQSMQDWIDDLKRLSVGDAVHVVLVCAQALAHAHKMNLIHRDVKPDNILITKNGIVKVADLGLAKATDEDQSMTQSGTGLGTPLYMPPEQARNAKYVDARSDIYALGCTLYKFLTGDVPFSADSTMELIIAKEKGKHEPASKKNKQVSEKLDLIIEKSMMKDPDHRYQTCEEFIADLSALGLAADSLSFIESDEKATLGSSSGSTIQSSMKLTAPTRKEMKNIPSSSRDDARRQRAEQAAKSSKSWIARFKTSDGKMQIKKLTLTQIMRGLESGMLSLETRLSESAKSEAIPISQVPEFDDICQSILTKQTAEARGRDLQKTYNQIDKQYGRRKLWRYITGLMDSTMGLISLVVYLGLVVIAIYLAWLYLPGLISGFGQDTAEYFNVD